MLTQEILVANTELAGLTEAQINAIVALSKNDEDAVIGSRIGEIYRQMDATIENATGIKRNGDEKTYHYLERASAEMRERVKGVDDLTNQIKNLQTEKERLEKVIADGAGGEEVKKALDQAKRDLANVRNQYNSLKAEYETTKTNHMQELMGIRIDTELTSATKGLQFKQGYEQNVVDVLINQTLQKIKNMSPQYVDDGKGGQVLAFLENGQILRNPNNKLEPYTATELVERELKAMGVLDEGQQKPNGGGTKPPRLQNGRFVISDARTQIEATEMITKELCSQGLTKGSVEFEAKLQEIWRENNIKDLPFN